MPHATSLDAGLSSHFVCLHSPLNALSIWCLTIPVVFTSLLSAHANCLLLHICIIFYFYLKNINALMHSNIMIAFHIAKMPSSTSFTASTFYFSIQTKCTHPHLYCFFFIFKAFKNHTKYCEWLFEEISSKKVDFCL